MATNEITCQELVELVTEYLEWALPPETRQRFEAHIAKCEPCAIFLTQMRQTIALTGQLREADLGPRARGILLNLFRQWKAT